MKIPVMKRLLIVTALAFGVLAGRVAAVPPPTQVAPRPASAAPTYFPDRFDWTHRKPEDVGMNSALVTEAVSQAVAAETTEPKDMVQFLKNSFGKEPHSELVGPVRDRGPAAGLIVHRGAIVAEWGDPRRVDMTHSVTKTFLTTVVGLAWQHGLIHDVRDRVRDYMPPEIDLFDAQHNREITWDHLLRQSSDWQGTLWGKPDWADRPVGATLEAQQNRPMYEPGAHFKYNDVRVNVMALAALQVWRRPLPDVLRDEIMNPIGASSTWRWHGYENSWVEIDGARVQSVSGGGHWGGGMFIDSYDLARFGYLFLNHGRWKDRQIVSEQWIAQARTPGPANDGYGYANWYLNTGRRALPSAPETAVRFVGNGSNIVYIDWENDLVVVFRWIRGGPALNDIVGKIIASTKAR